MAVAVPRCLTHVVLILSAGRIISIITITLRNLMGLAICHFCCSILPFPGFPFSSCGLRLFHSAHHVILNTAVGTHFAGGSLAVIGCCTWQVSYGLIGGEGAGCWV